MRILNVVYSYEPDLYMGGPPVKVRALSEELVRRGHDVTVLTADHRLWKASRSSGAGGVTIVTLASWYRFRHTVTLNPLVFTWARQHVRRFDIVHIFGVFDMLGPVVANHARRAGIPYILEPLGMLLPPMRNKRGRVRKRVYDRMIGAKLLQGASLVVATSPGEREALISSGIHPDAVLIRPNGVDLHEFESLPSAGAFRRRIGAGDRSIILFLGRLTPIKHPEHVVLALPQLPNAVGVFVGPDEDGVGSMVAATAGAIGVADRVFLTGPLYGREKIQALVDADVLALPSEAESFGNVAVEAMACGTPVLVTEGAGVAPYVERGAGVVSAFGPQAFSQALVSLVADRSLRERLGRAGPAVARSLSWEALAEQVIAAYESAVLRRGAA